MSQLPRLTEEQRAVVQGWLPDAALVADLSWELMGTAVLHMRDGAGDYIVKAGGAGGAGNHHIDREIAAHQHFSGPWVRAGRAARMLRSDVSAKILLLEYLPGFLMEGTAAESDPALYRQAGELLAQLHGSGSRLDAGYEARLTKKALASLDAEHRITPDMVARLRAILLAYTPQPVTLVPTHGDWHPRNWLVDGDLLRPIDFGRADWRPAFTDFVRLAVRQFRADAALETAFLEGYGPDPRTPELWNILQVREAIGTAVWAYMVGDEAFELEGHRMIADVLGMGNRAGLEHRHERLVRQLSPGRTSRG